MSGAATTTVGRIESPAQYVNKVWVHPMGSDRACWVREGDTYLGDAHGASGGPYPEFMVYRNCSGWPPEWDDHWATEVRFPLSDGWETITVHLGLTELDPDLTRDYWDVHGEVMYQAAARVGELLRDKKSEIAVEYRRWHRERERRYEEARNAF